MARTFDAVENASKPTPDNSISQALLADTMDRLPKNFSGARTIEMEQRESQLAFGPVPIWLFGDRIPKANPDTPQEIQKKEVGALSSTIKSMGTKGLTDRDRENVHAAFNKQLEKTNGRPVDERASALRSFVDEVNSNLRTDSKYSFTENKTGIKDKLSFSLVDKGEGSLLAELPKRTVYDTKEYSLSKEPRAADHIPDPSRLPVELKPAFDHVMKQSREDVTKNKYVPALDAVSKELGLDKLKTQAELNKALGLSADSPTKDYYARLESLMMNKLGLAGQDYKTEFAADVNRMFLEKLKLKAGTATSEDVLKALKETKVPADAKK